MNILELFEGAKFDYDQRKEENVISGIDIFKFFVSDHFNVKNRHVQPLQLFV